MNLEQILKKDLTPDILGELLQKHIQFLIKGTDVKLVECEFLNPESRWGARWRGAFEVKEKEMFVYFQYSLDQYFLIFKAVECFGQDWVSFQSVKDSGKDFPEYHHGHALPQDDGFHIFWDKRQPMGPLNPEIEVQKYVPGKNLED
jgi:hypothetical protein